MSAAPEEVEAGAARCVTDSPAETERFAERLARALATGDLVVLSGPLGAGKTRFVAGLARGLESARRVRSPSFTLVHEYGGARPLVHLDLYRLEGADVEGLGFEEFLERGAVVVEWGEKLPARLRADALTLAFAIEGEQRRSITATASGARGRALLEAVRALDRGGERAG